MRPVVTDALTITFDARTCIHARRCVLGLPGVFRPGARGGWIQPGDADPEALVRVIEACPSGALSYTRKQGAEEPTPEVNTARLWENGPVELRGEIVIGEESYTRVTLCRCGKSANKPFCDNSHIEAGFTATSEPAANEEAAPLEARNGPLNLRVAPNGPAIISGNLELIAGSGRALDTTEKLYLCRCGASGNKPYCDGSHKEAGFTTE
ncbi:CDGSH iron-sulfur domain-containing protein [Rhodophyticola porphyridii]|uniref:CDGSH iron-sulfur domain-containing protein n=1 Tax=Rhodophyticola porphyridii TaxID=1852017 RepID=UPI0035CFCE61